MNFKPTAQALPAALLLSILAAAVLCYWVGLTGPFLLDDLQNLAPLGSDLGIRSMKDWLRFVTGGEAGNLGRPVSLASFTLNALNWPADPWPFKLTNLLIHLINGTLVYVLARQLYSLTNTPNANLCAWFCAALWTLHPLQVSTVLYVIQRMTELSTLFCLAGLCAYVHGRALAARELYRGYAWMIAGIAGGGLFATLSKENGALLPLFALCLELTVLRGLPHPPGWRHASALLLRIPTLALVAYLVLETPQWLAAYEFREFSPAQRIETQGLILLDYLYRIFIPRLSGSGLFFDHYPVVSSSLVAVTCWLAIFGMMAIAVVLRRRQPLIAAAILWFFAGHLLESSVLPLELYFEHRNYLPLFGPALALGLLLSRSTPARITIAASAVAVLSLLTHAQARVWGDELLAARVWPVENPNSARAHEIAVIAWQKQLRFDLALDVMRTYAARDPDTPTTRLHFIEVSCAFNEPVEDYAKATIPLLRTGAFTFAAPDTIEHLIRLRARGACIDLTQSTLLRMIAALKDNPHVLSRPDQVDYLTYIEATAYATDGNLRAAIGVAESAARRSTRTNFSYWQAVWALEAGDIEAAKRYADRAYQFQTRLGLSNSDPFLDALRQHLQPSFQSSDSEPEHPQS